MALNGVLMISPALNFETIGFAFGNDLPYILFVPGYAATAWYHKALPGDLQALSLDEVVKQATEFALNEYTLAMMKGQSLATTKRNAVAEKLARYTGLSKEYVLQAKLRISMQRFAKELLRNEGRVVGRYDSRYTGIDADDAGEDAGVRRQRGGRVRPVHGGDQRLSAQRSQSRRRARLRDSDATRCSPGTTAGTVAIPGRHEHAAANRCRPIRYLKLFVACGYYDLATPPATVKYSVEHMRLPPELQKNIDYQVLRRRPHDVHLRAVDGEAAQGCRGVLRIGAQARTSKSRASSLAPESMPARPSRRVSSAAALELQSGSCRLDAMSALSIISCMAGRDNHRLTRRSSRSTLDECRELYVSSGQLCAHEYPHLIAKQGDEFVQLMDDLHRALVLKMYFAFARPTANGRRPSGTWPRCCFEHLWDTAADRRTAARRGPQGGRGCRRS